MLNIEEQVTNIFHNFPLLIQKRILLSENKTSNDELIAEWMGKDEKKNLEKFFLNHV